MSRKIFKINKKKCSHKKNVYKMKHKSKKAKKRVSRRRMKIIGGEGEQKRILLIIDPQNDFMDIQVTFDKRIPPFNNDPFDQDSGSKGLPVPNANNDMNKLAEFLEKNPNFFNEIHVSLDSHTTDHIGHIGFWNNSSNEIQPRPLETFYVNPGDPDFNIYVGNWDGTPKNPEQLVNPENLDLQVWAYHYILKMQEIRENNKSKPIPCLWAEHCIIDTDGWKVQEKLKTELNKYKEKVFYHEKGTNDLVEMYSIFSAEIPYEDLKNITQNNQNYKYISTINTVNEMYKSSNLKPIEQIEDNHEAEISNPIKNYNTNFNSHLFKKLIGENKNNEIYVCGEAKTHCVKTSLEDMIEHCDEYGYESKNIYLINDLTSGIPGFPDPEQDLKGRGIQITTSEELMNNNNNTDTSVENPKI